MLILGLLNKIFNRILEKKNYNFVRFLFNCSNGNATVVTQLFISKLLSKIVTKHTIKELTYSERNISIEMRITRST